MYLSFFLVSSNLRNNLKKQYLLFSKVDFCVVLGLVFFSNFNGSISGRFQFSFLKEIFKDAGI